MLSVGSFTPRPSSNTLTARRTSRPLSARRKNRPSIPDQQHTTSRSAEDELNEVPTAEDLDNQMKLYGRLHDDLTLSEWLGLGQPSTIGEDLSREESKTQRREHGFIKKYAQFFGDTRTFLDLGLSEDDIEDLLISLEKDEDHQQHQHQQQQQQGKHDDDDEKRKEKKMLLLSMLGRSNISDGSVFKGDASQYDTSIRYHPDGDDEEVQQKQKNKKSSKKSHQKNTGEDQNDDDNNAILSTVHNSWEAALDLRKVALQGGNIAAKSALTRQIREFSCGGHDGSNAAMINEKIDHLHRGRQHRLLEAQQQMDVNVNNNNDNGGGVNGAWEEDEFYGKSSGEPLYFPSEPHYSCYCPPSESSGSSDEDEDENEGDENEGVHQEQKESRSIERSDAYAQHFLRQQQVSIQQPKHHLSEKEEAANEFFEQGEKDESQQEQEQEQEQDDDDDEEQEEENNEEIKYDEFLLRGGPSLGVNAIEAEFQQQQQDDDDGTGKKEEEPRKSHSRIPTASKLPPLHQIFCPTKHNSEAAEQFEKQLSILFEKGKVVIQQVHDYIYEVEQDFWEETQQESLSKKDSQRNMNIRRQSNKKNSDSASTTSASAAAAAAINMTSFLEENENENEIEKSFLPGSGTPFDAIIRVQNFLDCCLYHLDASLHQSSSSSNENNDGADNDDENNYDASMSMTQSQRRYRRRSLAKRKMSQSVSSTSGSSPQQKQNNNNNTFGEIAGENSDSLLEKNNDDNDNDDDQEEKSSPTTKSTSISVKEKPQLPHDQQLLNPSSTAQLFSTTVVLSNQDPFASSSSSSSSKKKAKKYNKDNSTFAASNEEKRYSVILHVVATLLDLLFHRNDHLLQQAVLDLEKLMMEMRELKAINLAHVLARDEALGECFVAAEQIQSLVRAASRISVHVQDETLFRGVVSTFVAASKRMGEFAKEIAKIGEVALLDAGELRRLLAKSKPDHEAMIVGLLELADAIETQPIVVPRHSQWRRRALDELFFNLQNALGTLSTLELASDEEAQAIVSTTDVAMMIKHQIVKEKKSMSEIAFMFREGKEGSDSIMFGTALAIAARRGLRELGRSHDVNYRFSAF